jgi:putative tricarboxylic transport membrane protein
MGGHTEISLFSTSEFKSFQPMGIRPLAILQAERHADFPEIPTARELGYDVTFCVDNWWFAPAGTPPERVAAIAAALREAMSDPLVQEAFASHTLDPTFLAGEAFADHLERMNADIVAAAAQAQ